MVRPAAVLVLLPLAVFFVCPTPAVAGRFSGIVTYSLQHSRDNLPDTSKTSPDTWVSDNWSYETVILNYQDILFSKNTLLLSANLSWHEYPYTPDRDFRPIYFLDLRSYGYALTSSYSPYSHKVTDYSRQYEYSEKFRDWRTAFSTNYEKWPTLSITHALNRTFLDIASGQTASRSSSLILQSGYNVGILTTQASFSSFSAHTAQAASQDNLTRTTSGTIGVTKASPQMGSFNSSYNYYATRRWYGGHLDNNAITHSVTAFYSSPVLYNLIANASYSGRLFTTSRRTTGGNSRGEVFSGQLAYAPTGYLTFDVTKGYQVSSEASNNQITEYLAMSTTVTRYLRRGVDTRLAATRTIFQQSSRGMFVTDSTTYSDRRGRYTLDTYYGSLAFEPVNYVKALLDVSLGHDHQPVVPDQKYQLNRSLDIRMNLSRTLEGRITYNTAYQGAILRLDKVYSQNINTGLTFIPRANINLNLTYVYSRYRTTLASHNSSLSAYMGYTFRRAFNVGISFNGQEQAQPLTDSAAVLRTATLRPYTWNAQLFINLSLRSTLSVSYLYSSAPAIESRTRKSGLVQTLLTIQL